MYRKERCYRYNRKRTIAGIAVLSAFIGAWYLSHAVLPPLQRPPGQISEAIPPTVLLDFHERTSERSDQVRVPGSIETPHLPRSLLNLQMRLPLGTEDGQYSLQFRNSAGGIANQTTGTAKWEGETETLSARIDLRTIEPGQYTLAVRKGASSPRRYSVFVD